MSGPSDQECLAILIAEPRDRVAAERAIETLFHRHDGSLQRQLQFQFAFIGEELADICQETWIRVWTRIDSSIQPDAFRNWLFRVGANLAIDVMRKKASRPATAFDQQDVASRQADHVHELGFREKLQHCVDRLTPDHRAFLDRLFNLESSDEIAAALGRTKARIFQIKHEIRRQLLDCLGWQR